jgi:hypothetical protein
MLGLLVAAASLAVVLLVATIVVVVLSFKQVTAPGKPPAMKVWIGRSDRAHPPDIPPMPELRKQ